MSEDKLFELAKLVTDSKMTVVITGAGISTDSGLPDFRSEGGLWQNVDPMEVASFEVFNEDPVRFWDFYRQRLTVPENTRPNVAHHALRALEEKGLLAGIITQNIDGLHQLAGSEKILEVHGSNERLVCLSCGNKILWADYEHSEQLPLCSCGTVLKPDVVLFGEQLPACTPLAMAWCYDADLILCIGTSLKVYPVASWPLLNQANGGKFAVLTSSETPLDQLASVVINEPLGEVLPMLNELVSF